jgi:simple sugar transport system substrate-binding protein
MYKVSGTLTGPSESDTGLKFLDKESVSPYLKTKSRYEGTSTAVTVIA